MGRRQLGATIPSIKALIMGKEGTRKSNTAIQMAKLKKPDGSPLRVLLIDSEYKSIQGYSENRLKDDGINLNNILEIRTRDIEIIDDLTKRFANNQPIPELIQETKTYKDPVTKKEHPIVVESFSSKDYFKDGNGDNFVADVIIIDSISVLSEILEEGRYDINTQKTLKSISDKGLVGFEKTMALDSVGLTFLDRAKLKKLSLEIIRRVLAITEKHVIFISRTKDAKETKIINGKMEILDLGYEILDATSFKFVNYEVNTIIHCYKDKGFEIVKDSSDIFSQGEIFADFDITRVQTAMSDPTKTKTVFTPTQEAVLEQAINAVENSIYKPQELIFADVYDKITKSESNQKIAKDFCKEKGITWKELEASSGTILIELQTKLK